MAHDCEIIPPQGGGPKRTQPVTHARSLDDRSSLEMRFPWLLGYRHFLFSNLASTSYDIKMTGNALPCLDLLEATPRILRSLMSEISDADARWKPSLDRFSIAEVLAHLSHSESNCYRLRLDRFLAEDRPELEPDDAQMWLDRYRDADPDDEFDHFEAQRETNVEFLRGLPTSVGDRAAMHKELGEITLAQMLHEWALHDLGHVRQIAELVRARKYAAGAGPFGKSYQLKP